MKMVARVNHTIEITNTTITNTTKFPKAGTFSCFVYCRYFTHYLTSWVIVSYEIMFKNIATKMLSTDINLIETEEELKEDKQEEIRETMI